MSAICHLKIMARCRRTFGSNCYTYRYLKFVECTVFYFVGHAYILISAFSMVFYSVVCTKESFLRNKEFSAE